MIKLAVNWPPEGCWFIAIFSMLVILIGSGLAGSFFFFALLRGVANGKLARGWSAWSRCVATSAFLISISATMMAGYFGAELSLWLSAAIWPVIALPLHGGYWVAVNACPKQANRGTSDVE